MSIERIINFKTDVIKNEFNNSQLDNRLKIIIYALAGFCFFKLGKSITLTEIFRTQEMQDEYYKNDPLYQQKKWLSTHQLWRAADLSIMYFTDTEIGKIVEFLHHFAYGKPNISTFLIHDVGFGKHAHLQVSSENNTRILNVLSD